MIAFLVTQSHAYTLDDVKAAAEPGKIVLLPYERALDSRTLPRATYVFTDLDRLNPAALAKAASLYRTMRRAGLTALNDPARFVGRYGLLRALHAAGINPFTAWRASPQPTPARWPVFLRTDQGHQAPLTGLIEDPATLAEKIQAALAVGQAAGNLIVVEYCAEPLPGGLFRKLSVYRFGESWFADSCVHDRTWIAKVGADGLGTPELYADELRIMRDNPFRAAVEPAFALAGVEYGRVDFGLVDGRPRIYEINTNPHVQFLGDTPSPFRSETRRLFRAQYLAALRAADAA